MLRNSQSFKLLTSLPKMDVFLKKKKKSRIHAHSFPAFTSFVHCLRQEPKMLQVCWDQIFIAIIPVKYTN